MSLSRPKLPGEDHFRALLDLISDPEKYKKRLDELIAREQAAFDAAEKAIRLAPEAEAKLAQAKKLEAEAIAAKETADELAKSIKKQGEAMRDAETRFNAERLAKRQELNAREDAVKSGEEAVASARRELADKMAQAERTLAEAQALRAQFQAKLDAIQKAAA
jgi:chromosome segregation ATPase